MYKNRSRKKKKKRNIQTRRKVKSMPFDICIACYMLNKFKRLSDTNKLGARFSKASSICMLTSSRSKKLDWLKKNDKIINKFILKVCARVLVCTYD